MKDALNTLAKLAELDKKIRACRAKLNALPLERDELIKKHETLSELVAQAQAEVDDTKKLIDARRHERQAAKEKLEHTKEKAQKVSSLKGVDAIEREIDGYRKQIESHGATIQSLEEATQKAQHNLAKRVAQLASSATVLAQAQAEIQQEISENEVRMQALSAARGRMTPDLPREILSRYQRTFDRLGNAIEIVERDSCPACRLAFPAQLLIKAQRGQELTTCPQCMRIIIHYGVVGKNIATDG